LNRNLFRFSSLEDNGFVRLIHRRLQQETVAFFQKGNEFISSLCFFADANKDEGFLAAKTFF